MADALSPLRTDRLIWWTRLIQALFVIIVLGVTGSWSTMWTGLGCSPPAKVAFNVACASLTFLVLLFLIPTTGPLSKTLLWNRWVQIALDALFLLLWIVAAAVSTETCSDLCTACHYPKFDEIGFVWWEQYNLYCECYADGSVGPFNPLDKRQSPANPLVRRAGTSAAASEARTALNTATKASEISVKKGLDAALVLLFALTLFYGLYKFFQKPNPATGNVEMTAEQQENTMKGGETVTETAVPGS